MSVQLKGAATAAAVGVVFVGLELIFHISTGIAGIFIMGMAGGLLIADRMSHAAKPQSVAG